MRKEHSMMLLSIASQFTWGTQGFITFVIAGRYLPQKEFGFVVIANAVLFGCQCLLLGPVTNPTLRFGAVSHSSVRLTYLIYCTITGSVVAGFLLGSGQIGRLVDNDPGFVALLEFLGIPFATTSLYSVQKIVLSAKMRYGTVLAMDILFTTANVAALALLHTNAMLNSAVWFYVARSGAAILGLIPALALLLVPRCWIAHQYDQPFNPREYLQHSKYSSISMLSAYGQGQVDTLAVAHFLSPLAAATYGAAKVFYTGMTMTTSGLIMVALPASSRIASTGAVGLRSYYRRALLVAYAILLPGSAALAIFAGPIIHLCFGSRYAEAVPIVRIFCIAALVLPVSSITDAVANGAGWFRRACAAAVAGAVIGVAASVGLTLAFGVVGAALAPLSALTSSALVVALLTWDKLSSPTTSAAMKAESIVAVVPSSGD
jgi:O-antigen/teichoic acid export membrane protein